MTTSKEILDRLDETLKSTELVSLDDFHLEPRCRVCRNDGVRQHVNGLLARGASYAMVVRTLQDENAKLDTCDQVTIDSVRNHCARHFPVQNVAKATFREILERRAQQNQVDFVDGVATAITPMAFLETVMAKSYETLVDSDTKVDVSTGINAASRLQAIVDSGDAELNLLELKLQVNRIIDAVRTTVPNEMWGQILQKVEPGPCQAHEADANDFDDTNDDAAYPLDLGGVADFDDD